MTITITKAQFETLKALAEHAHIDVEDMLHNILESYFVENYEAIQIVAPK